MSTVRLIPMGVGEAFSARHYTSCLAMGADDQWLLIDCPHPLRKMLREGSIAAGLPEPNAMVLATMGERPHARTVLLKAHGDDCFTFYTNRTSRKGNDLAADPRCCAVFP